MRERTRIQRKREKATAIPSIHNDALQRSSTAPEQTVDEVPPIVQEVLSSSSQPLDANTREFMEPSFGHDFSKVRIHADERAAESAQAVNALAYTMGRDVVFGEGQYVPGTSEGKRLLAHELMHVVQQTSSRMADTAVLENIAFNDPTDHFERIADQVADSVIAERHSTTTEKRTLTSPALEGTDELNSIPTIQRKVDTLSPPESDTTANVPTTMTEGGQQKQQKPIISPETEAQMHTDVEFIVGKLREQILLAREEWEILGVIEKWASEDGRYQQMTGYQGSDYLDKFLLILKLRIYTRNTIRSAWVTQWASVYDDLWHELEDERLDKFKSLLARSHKQTTAGPESERMENIWASLGKKEAIAMFGMLKGMGTGLTGMADTGAWAITKAMRAAGLNVSDPESASKWLGEQYDFLGDELIGKEWKQGEPLLLGMNAGEIGTAGGGVIWNLVTIGAGGAAGAPKWAGMALKGFGVLGSLKGVEDSANSIANLVLKMQQEGTLTAGNLVTNGEFILEVTKMATSIFGAVSGGSALGGQKAADATKVAEAVSATMKRVGILLDVAEMTAQVSRIAEIGASTMSPEEKDKATSQVVIDLITKGFAVTHQTAEYHEQFGSVKPVGREEPLGRSTSLLDQYGQPVGQEEVTQAPVLVDQYGRPASQEEVKSSPVLLDEHGRPAGEEKVTPAPVLLDQYGRLVSDQKQTTQLVHLVDEHGRPVEAVTKPFTESEPEVARDIRDISKDSLTLHQRQRALELRSQAQDYEAQAVISEKKADAIQTYRPDRADRMQQRASLLRNKASLLLREADQYVSGARSATEDLPGPEDIPEDEATFFEKVVSETKIVRVPLSDLERKPENLPRLVRPLMLSQTGNRVVYRVEGNHSKVQIDPNGNVRVAPEETIFLNFGSEDRALEFLRNKGYGRIVAFEVDEKWVQSIRSAAIPEYETKAQTGRQPRLVDIRFGEDQMEISDTLTRELQDFIIPGTGRVLEIK